MAVTRSTSVERAQNPRQRIEARGRVLERVLLLLTSALILAALSLTAAAKMARIDTRIGGSDSERLNLSTLDRREQLLPFLQWISSPAERQYIAGKIFEHVRSGPGSVSHVGEISQIRVPIHDVLRTRGLTELQARAHQVQSASPGAETIVLLDSTEVARLKPFFVVRDNLQFRNQLILWSFLFFLSFWAVHIFWSVRETGGPQYVLPSVLLLSGVGFTLMVTLRDPVRDTLAFSTFAQGVAGGCVVLAIASTLDYRRISGKLSYVFLIASLLLSAGLILFGSGPTGSDAKVNLLGFQPAEVIRVLIVFFLAGYFAERWEFLRTLRDQRKGLEKISRWVEVPRLEYLLPVVVGIVVSLAFFFLQKDLGPALLIACLFLAMYAIARDRYLFALVGMVVILGGFASGYFLGFPKNVAGRVSMWLSPWDNSVRGGEQVAHSLWAFATGGAFGTGLGLGDPQWMPAAHTDLILAALGEEWGFLGVTAVLALYAALVWFGIRAALRAGSDYNFFLALGLTLAFALQILLIAGGVLGLIPLSGVVVPFLSYGRTGLITNFAIIGILFSLSREVSATQDTNTTEPFRVSTRAISYVIAGLGACLLVKAFYIQVIDADSTAGAGALALQADGERRYEYNPRLLAVAHSIPRGTIYDRNGIPLATSNWNEIAQNQDRYSRMGLSVGDRPAQEETRHYPLGPAAFHLLGDLRTRVNWSARNSSYAERDFMRTLQGYDDRASFVEVFDPRTRTSQHILRLDLRELLPLLRHRWQPNHPEVRKVLERDRNLHLSIDARLQLKTAELLQNQLRQLGRTKGAVVVLDPEDGDLLASVSYPWPSQSFSTADPDSDDALLDRARYGLYPPGSSFKIVTAIAALRKDPKNADQIYQCKRLPDGRTGNFIEGWKRPIHDDVKDSSPHGAISMRAAIVVSCNAYFAQLGTYRVGPEALLDIATQLGISIANPSNVKTLRAEMPQTSYGQGQVVASPFQMARVAATIAHDGSMPFGRWVTDQTNPRQDPPQAILNPELSSQVGEYMRGVVTSGTGRSANLPDIPMAGKTGTAELMHAPSHAWFIGFAPYGGSHKLAFSVLIENGQYGGTAAAPLAADVMKAAKALGYLQGAP
jgi:cell division protein FtsW (lipid II flippase)